MLSNEALSQLRRHLEEIGLEAAQNNVSRGVYGGDKLSHVNDWIRNRRGALRRAHEIGVAAIHRPSISVGINLLTRMTPGWITVIGFIFSGIVAWNGCRANSLVEKSLRESARAVSLANEANAVARKSLVSSERPHLDFRPVHFDGVVAQNGEVIISITYEVENHGRFPAERVVWEVGVELEGIEKFRTHGEIKEAKVPILSLGSGRAEPLKLDHRLTGAEGHASLIVKRIEDGSAEVKVRLSATYTCRICEMVEYKTDKTFVFQSHTFRLVSSTME